MWQEDGINTIRALIGDFDSDNQQFSDDRLTQLFLIASNLVLLDVNFQENYEINIKNQIITPDPSEDTDFISLVSLRAACVLLNSEMKSQATKRITMSDGPSRIAVDTTDLVKSIKDMAEKISDKYEEALLIYKTDGRLGVGVGISGPYSPGSFILGSRTGSGFGHNFGGRGGGLGFGLY